MYEFYVLMARTISHSFAALTHEIHVLFLRLEHKINLFFSQASERAGCLNPRI